MSEVQPQGGNTEGTGAAQGAATGGEGSGSSANHAAELEALRKQNADLSAKLDTVLGDAAKARDEKRGREAQLRKELEEQGQYKQLAEEQGKALADLQAQVADLQGYKAGADAWSAHIAARLDGLDEGDKALLSDLPPQKQLALLDRLGAGSSAAGGATPPGPGERAPTLPPVTPASSGSVTSDDFGAIQDDQTMLEAMRENPDGFRRAVKAAGPSRPMTTAQRLAARKRG